MSYKYPKLTNLPKHRVHMVRRFCHIGINCTGHIMAKIKGKEHKFHMLSFTCLNVRACHIELIPEMSTNQFCLAFARFSSFYGVPFHVYSDNAKSFIAAVNMIAVVFRSSPFKERFGMHNISYICIPLFSPWIDATWE